MKRICAITLILTISATVFANGNSQKIIGGEDAVNGEFPWIAGITEANESDLFFGQFCGGSLIAPRWVLTAAHCLFDDFGNRLSPNEVDVFFDVHQLNNPNPSKQIIEVEEIILHPNYDDFTLNNDIALLKLKSSVNLQRVSLPAQNDFSNIAAGKVLTIMGWGVTNVNSGDFSNILQKADVNAISTTVCNGQNVYDGDVTNNMFCAAAPGKDACQGDSGGPIVYKDGNEFIQQGIISWGEDCGDPDFPGVYTKVANYIDWINGIVDFTTSVEAHYLEKFEIFQTHQNIIIQWNAETTAKDAQLHIIDPLGRNLMRKNFNSNINLDLSGMAQGMYFIMLQSENDRMVKQIMLPAN